jgi:hypothetical protein
VLILEYAFIEVRLHEDGDVRSVVKHFFKASDSCYFGGPYIEHSLTKSMNCRMLKAP